MIWILSIPAVLLIGLFVVDFQISAPGYDGPESEHFNGKKFLNPDEVTGRSLFDMAKWAVTGDRGDWDKLSAKDVNLWEGSEHTDAPGEITVTFVNHSTFLVQMAGMNILTDPVWANRVSPYTWVGPKRMRPPGIKFEDLPPIDLVLLSHNHYDHLDIKTVRRLKEEHDPFFVLPLGVEQYLEENDINRTVELDWWDQHLINESARITAVPAQHFSGRGVFDRDQTLWCGYVLETAEAGTLYFAGDTAYGSFFGNIGQAFDIDVSLIPIGAYKPRWFMHPIHIDPDEAVQIHQEVGSKSSIGSHFGTFPLADEAMTEPQRDLAAALEKYGVSPRDFRALEEGQSFSYQPEKKELRVAGE